MNLGRLLVGIAAAAVGVLAIAVTVKVVKGIIDKKRLKKLAQNEGIKRALISSVDRCNNKVTLKDLNSRETVTYQGDRIANDVKKGIII